MLSSGKQYELVVFGATGYTGRLCAEYITMNLPTDLRWAVAGRSAQKLSALVRELKSLNPDREQPGIETAQLNKEDLSSLARKAKLVINTVGPYHLYGTPVVKACAENGTHYLDVTGETPWVRDIIRKYDETAREHGAIVIPEIGIESAPSDLLSWAMASLIRDQLSVGTKEVTMAVHMSANPSGGTLATVLSIVDSYGAKEMSSSMKSWSLSPIQGSRSPWPRSITQSLLGVQNIPPLGTLSTSVSGTINRAIVHRTWGLLGGPKSTYGPRFHYREFWRVRNVLMGVILHFALAVGFLMIAIPPVRWLLARLVTAPGQGPTKEATSRERVEYRAVAIADQDTAHPKRALGRMRYEGGIYYCTGMFLAEAAMVILRDQTQTAAKEMGGGVLTPALLGTPFIERLRKAGVVFETRLLDE